MFPDCGIALRELVLVDVGDSRMRYFLFTALFLTTAQASVRAQEDVPAKTKTQEIVAIARASLGDIQGTSIVEGKAVDLEPVGPVLTFVEPVFKIASGTLWVWGKSGRPSAVMSLATVDKRRFYEFHSFSEHPLDFKILGDAWRPKPSWSPLDIPNSSAPLETEQRRLSQMKKLVERFRSTERVIPGDKIVEMRILPTPIYRYPNSTQEMDGALFVISRDGDPEALLVIETKKNGWQFMAARLSGHVPTVYLDEKPYVLDYRIGPQQPYFYVIRKATENEDPK